MNPGSSHQAQSRRAEEQQRQVASAEQGEQAEQAEQAAKTDESVGTLTATGRHLQNPRQGFELSPVAQHAPRSSVRPPTTNPTARAEARVQDPPASLARQSPFGRAECQVPLPRTLSGGSAGTSPLPPVAYHGAFERTFSESSTVTARSTATSHRGELQRMPSSHSPGAASTGLSNPASQTLHASSMDAFLADAASQIRLGPDAAIPREIQQPSSAVGASAAEDHWPRERIAQEPSSLSPLRGTSRVPGVTTPFARAMHGSMPPIGSLMSPGRSRQPGPSGSRDTAAATIARPASASSTSTTSSVAARPPSVSSDAGTRKIEITFGVHCCLTARSRRDDQKTWREFALNLVQSFNNKEPRPRSMMLVEAAHSAQDSSPQWALTPRRSAPTFVSTWAVSIWSPYLAVKSERSWRDEIKDVWKFLTEKYFLTGDSTSFTELGCKMPPEFEIQQAKRIAQACINFEPALEALLPERRAFAGSKSNWLHASPLARRGLMRPQCIGFIERSATLDNLYSLMQDGQEEFCWNFGQVNRHPRVIIFRKPPPCTGARQAIAWIEFTTCFLEAAKRCRKDLVLSIPSTVGGLRWFMRFANVPWLNDRTAAMLDIWRDVPSAALQQASLISGERAHPTEEEMATGRTRRPGPEYYLLNQLNSIIREDERRMRTFATQATQNRTLAI